MNILTPSFKGPFRAWIAGVGVGVGTLPPPSPPKELLDGARRRHLSSQTARSIMGKLRPTERKGVFIAHSDPSILPPAVIYECRDHLCLSGFWSPGLRPNLPDHWFTPPHPVFVLTFICFGGELGSGVYYKVRKQLLGVGSLLPPSWLV